MSELWQRGWGLAFNRGVNAVTLEQVAQGEGVFEVQLRSSLEPLDILGTGTLVELASGGAETGMSTVSHDGQDAAFRLSHRLVAGAIVGSTGELVFAVVRVVSAELEGQPPVLTMTVRGVYADAEQARAEVKRWDDLLNLRGSPTQLPASGPIGDTPGGSAGAANGPAESSAPPASSDPQPGRRVQGAVDPAAAGEAAGEAGEGAVVAQEERRPAPRRASPR